jgi:pyruvate formate-lyase/glycerol dehydratase family glycyl radical enzyme
MATTLTPTMTERVRKLRQQSLETVESISIERAELLTEFYKQNLGLISVPVERAMAFAYLMEHKSIAIYEGELIVGEKGDKPKSAPTFPELCCHTLEDLDILDTRPLTSFKVSPETRKTQEEVIIPFWQGGKSIGDLVLDEMTQEWRDAFEAGIFTEFMTQRAPGHTVADDKIYHNGMLDFLARIDASLARLDYLNDPHAYDKQEELKAMRIAAGALIRFGERYSQLAREQAQAESDAARRAELEKIAEACAHVPAHAPRDFHEAIQYYWFVHLGVTTELNTWDAYSPGHLDQHLFPFYEKGLADGTLTRESAKELLECLWVKFNNQPAPPKVGVTAAESGTYTDFSQINIGGLRPDGSDGVNEVSYLLLDVVEEMRLLQPSASIQVSKKSPDRLIKRAAKIIRTGFGQPSIFNVDAIVQELVRMGKDVVDARCGGTSGCVETGAFGKENYNLTGYFNLPKVLELTLHNGLDPRTGKQLGPQTGDPHQFASFDELFSAFEQQLLHFVDIKVRGNQVVERMYARFMSAPFLSLLTDDCIANGKDYHDGGARYNTTYIMGVGIGSMADALSAIKYHVFDEKTFGMDELLAMLAADFSGHERTRQLLLNRTPKYGNDDDYADSLMVRVFEAYFNAVDGRRSTKGGVYHIDMLPTTCHIYFGSVTGALPDGRLAWTPLSEGVSPVQGADRHGPTAAARSVAKMDHVRTGGTLLNQKFTPQVLDSEDGMNGLVHLVRGYFNLDGHHIQFNVVDADTLRAAQKNPEQYRSLIVRVAGYSDYFCDLSKALQDEIIARTAHEGF